jgi:hypothetical protein
MQYVGGENGSIIAATPKVVVGLSMVVYSDQGRTSLSYAIGLRAKSW